MDSKIDFINGNTRHSLLRMFLPLLAAMTLTMIYSMVDSFWVGNMLGEHGMSALTAGTAVVLIMNSLSMGMGNGISVMVANLVGAEDRERLPGAVATILTLSAAISAALCVAGELLVGPILRLLGTPEEIFRDAALYLTIYLVGNAALFLYMQFTSVFRGFGDPMLQMKGMLLTAVFNAAADPFCIRLWGLAGAAGVTVASELLCLLYALAYYRRHRLFTVDFRRVNAQDVKTMLRLSIPTTVQAIMPPVSSAVMISLIAPFGLTAMAGFGVARNLELILFMPTTGMCMAVTAIVGQCAGAARHDRADAYLKTGMALGGCMIAAASVLVIVFSAQLTGLFGQGSEVAAVVGEFFRIISVGYVLYMLTSCMQGYITGVGRPGLAMLLLILYYIVLRIPAALLLKEVLGLSGIWYAFLASHILSAVAALILVAVCRSRFAEASSRRPAFNS